VFFNLFFAAEPFAAISIAHGTQKFVLGALWDPKGPKLEAKGREWGRGFGGRHCDMIVPGCLKDTVIELLLFFVFVLLFLPHRLSSFYLFLFTVSLLAIWLPCFNKLELSCGSQRVWGSAVSSPSGIWSPDRKCILDTLRAQKTRLVAAKVPVSRFNSPEPLDATGGTRVPRNPGWKTLIYIFVMETLNLVTLTSPQLVYKILAVYHDNIHIMSTISGIAKGRGDERGPCPLTPNNWDFYVSWKKLNKIPNLLPSDVFFKPKMHQNHFFQLGLHPRPC